MVFHFGDVVPFLPFRGGIRWSLLAQNLTFVRHALAWVEATEW